MDSNPQALPDGTVIAGFRIERTLGAGGFGITYQAVSAVTRRRVAIKEFFPRGIASRSNATRLVYSTSDAEVVNWALDRFERSTTELCELNHPNIVEVIHYVKENDTGYMIMEYVEGMTLEDWLRRYPSPPSASELRPVLEPILDALAYVHASGRIHRDVAPDNIMIRPDGRPVLIDFGAVKLIEQRTRTVQTFLVAKANYSPPEQTQQGIDLDRSADIYALGAVLYRAFAAKPPIDAELRIKDVAFGNGDPYVPLGRATAIELPAGVIATIDRALAFRAKDRLASIDDIRAGLGWAKDWTALQWVRPETAPMQPKPAIAEQERPAPPAWSVPSTQPGPPAQFTPPPPPPPQFTSPASLQPPTAPMPSSQAATPSRRFGIAAGIVAVVVLGALGMVTTDPLGWFNSSAARCASRNEMDKASTSGEASLAEFVAACPTGPLVTEARQRLDRLVDVREGRELDDAGYDTNKINSYLATCKRCADRERAQARLASVAEDERTFRQAAGDITRLEAYVSRCNVCRFKTEAQQAIEALRRGDPRRKDDDRRVADATAAYNRGTTHREKGEYDLAIREYNEAIRLNPNYPAAFNDRAISHRNKGDYDLAIADYNEALRLNPGYTIAFNNRGVAHFSKRDYERAIQDYSEAIRLDPKYALAYNNRGRVYSERREYERAIQDFNEAIQLNPKYGPAFRARGTAYWYLRNHDRAIADHTEAIRLDPKDSVAYNERGNAYSGKGEYDHAIQDYDEAIKLNPKDALYFYNRGTSYSNKHDYDRAISDLNEAIRLNPGYAIAYRVRGNAYSFKREYDRAITDLNEAIRLDPRDLTAYNNRGTAYFNKRDYDRAIQDYDQWIKLDNNNPLAFHYRGNAHRNNNSRERAIQDYRRALSLNPNENLKKQIETALRELGAAP